MPIPNRIKIQIKTPVENMGTIIYRPSMTLPNTQSNTVYINPLIPLNNKVIEEKKDSDELYSQFFSKNEFDSLINRTLTKKMEKKLTYAEAKKKGIIENNIELTLNTLFKENNSFFYGSKKYLIYDYDWSHSQLKVMKREYNTTENKNRKYKKDKKDKKDKNYYYYYFVKIYLVIIEKGNWNKIPFIEKYKLNCIDRKEKIRSAYADLFHLNYERSEFVKNKTKKNINKNNKTRKQNKIK
jgi:hypothetical protein